MNQSTPAVTGATELPLVMDAKNLQQMGFSRASAYTLLNREDMPVLRVGKRLFMRRDEFLSSSFFKSCGNSASQ